MYAAEVAWPPGCRATSAVGARCTQPVWRVGRRTFNVGRSDVQWVRQLLVVQDRAWLNERRARHGIGGETKVSPPVRARGTLRCLLLARGDARAGRLEMLTRDSVSDLAALLLPPQKKKQLVSRQLPTQWLAVSDASLSGGYSPERGNAEHRCAIAALRCRVEVRYALCPTGLEPLVAGERLPCRAQQGNFRVWRRHIWGVPMRIRGHEICAPVCEFSLCEASAVAGAHRVVAWSGDLAPRASATRSTRALGQMSYL